MLVGSEPIAHRMGRSDQPKTSLNCGPKCISFRPRRPPRAHVGAWTAAVAPTGARLYRRLAGHGWYIRQPDCDKPDAGGRYRAAILPGFWRRPDWLWQDPLPSTYDLLHEIIP